MHYMAFSLIFFFMGGGQETCCPPPVYTSVLDPLHVMAEPLALTRRIPELEEDAGAGKTETDGPESTRKFLEERVSLRYRREDEEPAGRKKFLPTSHLVFQPGAGLLTLLRVSCGTSMWRRRGMGTSDGGERQLGCWNGRRWWNWMRMSCCSGRV